MKRALRFILLSALGLVVLLGIGAGTALYWVDTDDGRERLRQIAVDFLSREFVGDFSIERIEGSVWGDLRLVGVSIHMGDAEVLTAPEIRGHYSINPAELMRGIVRIAVIEAEEPRINVTVSEDGAVDLFEIFASTVAEVDDGDDLTLLFDEIQLRDGVLTLTGVTPEVMHLQGLVAEGSIEIPEHGILVDVPRLSGRLSPTGRQPLELTAAVRFDDRSEPATIEIGPVEAYNDASQLTLEAVLRDAVGDLSNLHIDARVVLQPLAAVDLQELVDSWPLPDGIAGTITAQGDLDSLRFVGDLSVGEQRFTAGGSLDLRGAEPGFATNLHAEAVQIAKLIPQSGLSGTAAIRLNAAGTFASPADVDASMELRVDELVVDEQPFGSARAEARLHGSDFRLHAEIDGASGKAGVYATGAIAAEHSFVGDVYLADFDLTRLAGSEDLPQSAVNATARVRGTGSSPDNIAARADIYLGPSRIGAVETDTGVIRLALTGTALSIEEAQIASGRSRLVVAGALELDDESPSLVTAELTVPRLVLDDDDRIAAAGTVHAQAELRGRLTAPRLSGTASIENLRSEQVELARADLAADVEIGERGFATGEVNLRIETVTHPVALETLQLDLDLSPDPRGQGFALEVEAADGVRDNHRLGVDGVVASAQANINLRALRLGTSHGNWQLDAPATLTLDQGTWDLSTLRIVSGERAVEAQGTLPVSGEIDFSARATDIDVAFLSAFVAADAGLAGNLSAQFNAAGTATAPRATLVAGVDDVIIAGEGRGKATLRADLDDGRLAAEARFEPDAANWVRAVATIPVSLRTDRLQEARFAGPLDASIEAPSLPLAVFLPFVADEISNLAGTLSVNVSLVGDPAAPEIRGRLEIAEGRAHVRRLGVDIDAVTVRTEIVPGMLRLTEFRASSGKGRLDGNGAIRLTGALPESYELRLQATRWPGIATTRYQAQLGADLKFNGPADAPLLTGSVVIENADLRPDLRFLDSSAGPAERDPTITVIDTGRPTFERTEASGTDARARSPLLPEQIRADVNLVIKRGTRVRHEMADVELKGNLRIRIEPGKAAAVTGKLESVRGTVEIQGREFSLVRGEVNFGGGSVENPRLDILAQHRRSPYVIEALIGGTVREPTLELRSQPVLDQADILAVLLFGRPASQLDEGEKTTLQQQALSVTSGYAASVLGEAVSEALGLESLGIDLRNVDFGGGRIGFGRYITRNTYVSVTQRLGEDRGREVNLEYFLSARWKIVTATDSLGASGIDIIWQMLY